MQQAYRALRIVAEAQTIRIVLSPAASALVRVADLVLAVHEAVLVIPGDDTLTGVQAARLGLVTWSVPAQSVAREMELVLDMIRSKSAVALHFVKASVRMGQKEHQNRLEALDQVNAFYLTRVMQSADAHEGLRAFLEKRRPEWKNV